MLDRYPRVFTIHTHAEIQPVTQNETKKMQTAMLFFGELRSEWFLTHNTSNGRFTTESRGTHSRFTTHITFSVTQIHTRLNNSKSVRFQFRWRRSCPS